MADQPQTDSQRSTARPPDVERLAMLAGQTQYALVLTDTDAHVEWVNQAFVALTGYEFGEVQGRSIESILPSPSADPATVQEMRTARQEQRELATVIEARDKRGLPFWASVATQPLRDDTQQVTGYLVHLADITRERQADEALRQSRERLKITMAGSGIALWDWDVKTQRVKVNDRWAELLHWEDAPPSNAAAYDAHVHPEDRARQQEEMRRHLAGDTEMYEVEVRMRQGDGTYRWVRERGRVTMRDADGSPQRVAGTTLDIDAIKQAADAMQEATQLAESANRAKSEFIARMSHEIRTPLNAIIGMTTLLAGTSLDAAQRDYVSTIATSNRALLDLVNDLLDFSRIEAGRLELVSAPYDLWESVEGVLEQFTGQAFNRGLMLACAIAHDVPRMVTGDGARVRQVLLNLVGNAVKFTERGRVTVRVACTSAERGALLHLEVQDTGVGFDVKRLPELLEPFRQGDGSVTRRFGGSGLGLALVQRMVTLMGGTVDADSVVGRGSRFVVELPVGATDLPTASTRPDSLVTLVGGDAMITAAVTETVSALGCRFAEVSADSLLADVARSDLVLVFERDAATLLATLDALRQRGVRRIAVLWSPLMDLPLEQLSDTVTLLALPLLPSELLLAMEGRDVAAERDARRRSAAPRVSAPMATAKGTILVVEDNLANQKVTRGFLHRLGWHVDIVNNGREAVERAQTTRYDAILMDVQMPVMNGFVATGRIRKLEGAARHTPIIALTAGASMEERARCYEAGMDDFLTKPIREDALDAALTRWAQHADGDGHALVNRDVLSRLRDLPGEQGGDLIGELTAMFAARVDGVALTIRNEARQRRLDVVVREAHGLKGLALTLGAVAMAERCREIEEAANGGHADRIPGLVDDFERSWLETLPQLRAARRWIVESGATSPAKP